MQKIDAYNEMTNTIHRNIHTYKLELSIHRNDMIMIVIELIYSNLE